MDRKIAVICGLSLCVTFVVGCGGDRPGVHYGADHPPAKNIHDDANIEERMDILITISKTNNTVKVTRACKSLSVIGARAERAIPDLENLFDHPDEEIQAAAKKAVQEIKDAVAKGDSAETTEAE